jgi:hypothetical protein
MVQSFYRRPDFGRKENAMCRKLLSNAVVIAVGLMTLSPGVAGAEERPMKGMWAGNASLKPADQPYYAINNETGVGEATHLGKFTLIGVETVYVKFFPQFVSVEGAFTMTGADGDQVFVKYRTTGGINKEGSLDIIGTYCIVGGTGRFAGATGQGELRAVAFLSEGLPFIGFMDGVIDY